MKYVLYKICKITEKSTKIYVCVLTALLSIIRSKEDIFILTNEEIKQNKIK